MSFVALVSDSSCNIHRALVCSAGEAQILCGSTKEFGVLSSIWGSCAPFFEHKPFVVLVSNSWCKIHPQLVCFAGGAQVVCGSSKQFYLLSSIWGSCAPFF